MSANQGSTSSGRKRGRRGLSTRGEGTRTEDPRGGGEAQAARVPSRAAGGSYSGDEPQNIPIFSEKPAHDPANALPASVSDSSVETVEPELSHYKGIALKNVGRDGRGRVIPHKRSEFVAEQIKVWVAGGFNLNDIAIRMNVRPGLIKQEYATELAVGETQVHMDVHGHILKRAKESDRMAIFYAKSRMGYRDGESKPMDTGILAVHIHL